MSNDDFFSKCPKPPEPTKEELATSISDMITKAGITTCNNKRKKVDVGFSGGGFIFPTGGMAFRGTANVEETASIGCEQIQIIAKRYQECVQQVSCVLNQTSAKQEISSSINNIIKFKGTKFEADCDNLNIKQKGTIYAVSLQQLESREKAQIENATKTMLKDVIDVTTESFTEAGATPQGSKALADIQKKLDSTQFSQSVSQVLSSIRTSLNINNNLEIDVDGPIIIRGKQCNFDQEAYISYLATNIVSKISDNFLTNLGEIINEETVQIEAKAENTNPQKTSFMTYIIIGVIVVGAVIFLPKLMNKQQNSTTSSGGGSSVFLSIFLTLLPYIIILIVLYALYKALKDKMGGLLNSITFGLL